MELHPPSQADFERYLRARGRVDRFYLAFRKARSDKRRRLLGVAWARAAERLSGATAAVVAHSRLPASG